MHVQRHKMQVERQISVKVCSVLEMSGYSLFAAGRLPLQLVMHLRVDICCSISHLLKACGISVMLKFA